MKSVAQRFEDVALGNTVSPLEVGCRARHAPGSVKAAGGEAALLRPALQRLSRTGIQDGQLAESCGVQLGVEAALALQLTEASGQHALSDWRRRFALRLGCEGFERDAPYPDLEVDPVEERARQPALVAVNHGRRAAAGPTPIASPSARTRIGRSHEREASRISHRPTRPRDRDPPNLQWLAQGL